MGKFALPVVAALLLSLAEFPVFAQAPDPPLVVPAARSAVSAEAPNRILGFTAWDDEFLYIALQINKPATQGRNSAPFSNPLEDDAAIIALQMDGDRKAAQRTARTYVVAVSAMGGTQLYSGPNAAPLFENFEAIGKQLAQIEATEKDPAVQQEKRAALLAKLLRFKVNPQGAPLPGGAHVPGYTVEIAIPWIDLGGRPEPGARLGFNVAAQSRTPGSPALQSLSPGVKGEADLNNPSLWGELIISNSPGAPANGATVSPRVFANRPAIDGELTGGEWNPLAVFEFGERVGARAASTSLENTIAARTRPDFTPQPPRPVVPVVAPDPARIALAARRAQQVAPLILARYAYWFQADPRKAAPVQGVQQASGATALAAHPLEGTGPWFSYDRADWHRKQLMDARRAGIDVILPLYRGAPRDRQLYADKGLLVLATALQSLQQAGQDYPQVACWLDTNALIEVFGDRPDLREPQTQRALADLIRDFYRAIPAPFRYVVPLTAENGDKRAHVVFLSDAAAFKEVDASFVEALRRRFAADFDGADLVILGEPGFKGKAELDGTFSEAKEKGFQFHADGWIKTATVSPGYDPSFAQAPTTEKPALRSRRAGQTYRSDWTAALARQPDWILIDSWNDYSNGTQIAPTLEFGYGDADQTKVFSRLFAGSATRSLKFLAHDAPPAMLARQTYPVRVRVQNTGVEGWGPKSGPGQAPVAFAYRWLKGNQIVAARTVVPLDSRVAAGQNATVTLPVAAPGEGDFLLEIGAVENGRRGEQEWFSDGTNGSNRYALRIPVRVAGESALPAWAATLVRSDLPATLETGSVYDVQATLRNDGALPWRKADGVRVTLRLYRAAPASAGGAAPAETVVATADATMELAQDTLPGQEVAVQVPLALTTPDGSPLPAWSQEDLWRYVLRWEVAPGNGSGPRPAAQGSGEAPGISFAPAPIALVDFDFGARFTVDATPEMLPGERRQPVRLSLLNAGPQIWKKDAVRVGYHWYYQDGSEVIWEDETTPIAQDVPPGGRVKDMLAWITPPPYDGIYWLAWDVKVGDTWASTTAGARAFDQSVRAVRVIRGRLEFADLGDAYNLTGISDDYDMKAGNFDGQGRSFPAAFIPPYADAPLVPSSLWIPTARTGLDSPKRISFRWGPKGKGAENFVACRGQKVSLGKAGHQTRLLHIVAASTGKDITAELRLIFQEPSTQSVDLYSFTVSRWDRPPSRQEPIAFLAYRHHSPQGVQPGAVALYHYTIPIREPRKLVAIQLPDAPDIKIAAITFEK